MAKLNPEFEKYLETIGAMKDVSTSDLYTIYQESTNIDRTNAQIEQMIKAQKESINNNELASTVVRDTSLNISDYRKNKMYTGKEAVARMIQHILITKKGTYPNNPNFGVGIEDYLFELVTPQLRAEIETSISDQMSRWLTSELTKTEIRTKNEVQFLRNGNETYVTMAIFFTVYDNNMNGNTDEFKFSLFYTGDPSNRKVISQMDI